MLAIIFIILGAVIRVLSFKTRYEIFPPNFAPIAAMALFSGYYLPKKQAFIIPLVTMFISDLFIGFYNPLTMLSVYLSFILITLLGKYVKAQKSWGYVAGGVLTGSFLFYLITNFAVWMEPGVTYSRDLQGLLDCYIQAIPFYKYTLAGDIFYSAFFFLSYEFAKRFKISSRVFS